MISVDKVYKTVLYILNKEQRGYVTPAEFNHIAEVEQNAIFWSYFKEGAQTQQLNQANMQSDVPLFDLSSDVEYKLTPFTTTRTSFTSITTSPNRYPVGSDDIRWYNDTLSGNRTPVRIKSVVARYVSNTGGRTTESDCDYITFQNYEKIKRSKLTKPDKRNPVFVVRNNGESNIAGSPFGTELQIGVSPAASLIYVEVVSAPNPPKWNFTVGTQNEYLFSLSGSTDFELDASEESRLINNILLKFGVVVRDPSVIQVAMAEQQREAIEK